MGSYLLFLAILTSMFQIGYKTMLFQTRLLHFGLISCHPLQISLEISQFITGLLIELVELNIVLIQVFNLLSSLFCFIQLIGQVLVSCQTLFNCLLIMTALSQFFKVLYIVFNYRLQVCRWLWVSNNFSLVFLKLNSMV